MCIYNHQIANEVDLVSKSIFLIPIFFTPTIMLFVSRETKTHKIKPVVVSKLYMPLHMVVYDVLQNVSKHYITTTNMQIKFSHK